MVDGFASRGWVVQPYCPDLANWAQAACAAGKAALEDPVQRAGGLVCGGTWFVGVDALPNDSEGTVSGVRLPAQTLEMVQRRYGQVPALHRAQVSVVFPGYPQPRAGESDAAFRYRQNRDAAHVDGLSGVGTPKKRILTEAHGWILGVPLNAAEPGAAPFVIWEGSHRIMGEMFARCLGSVPPAQWGSVDLTAPYTEARRSCFEQCRRVEVMARPGESYLVHRFALHGVAPWQATAAEGSLRMVAYFRPEVPVGHDWLKPD